MGFKTGCHLANHRFGHEMKLLDSIVHAPRQRPAIERDDWVVLASGIGNQGRHGVGAFLENRFRQSSHSYTADGGGGQRPQQGGGIGTGMGNPFGGGNDWFSQAQKKR